MVKFGEGASLRTKRFCGFDPHRGYLTKGLEGAILSPMKHCNLCNQDKALEAFAWKNKAKGTRQSNCKECHKVYSKTHYTNNKDYYVEKASRNRFAGAVYGLTREEELAFRKRNNGLCELCNLRPASHIDHDHSTGNLRGHLCSGCNSGLGLLGDNLEGLEKAVLYLTNSRKYEIVVT